MVASSFCHDRKFALMIVSVVVKLREKTFSRQVIKKTYVNSLLPQ